MKNASADQKRGWNGQLGSGHLVAVPSQLPTGRSVATGHPPEEAHCAKGCSLEAAAVRAAIQHPDKSDYSGEA